MQRRLRQERRCGQTMIEYIIVLGILLAMLAMFVLFDEIFEQQSRRVMNLAASVYP